MQMIGLGAGRRRSSPTRARSSFAGEWPAVSPDGSTIAMSVANSAVFHTGWRATRHFDTALGFSDPLGARLQGLRRGDEPAWSPDGRRLAFVRTSGGHAHLFVANADGTGAQQITDGPERRRGAVVVAGRRAHRLLLGERHRRRRRRRTSSPCAPTARASSSSPRAIATRATRPGGATGSSTSTPTPPTASTSGVSARSERRGRSCCQVRKRPDSARRPRGTTAAWTSPATPATARSRRATRASTACSSSACATTGIYCRPVCRGAHAARRDRCVFFAPAAEARARRLPRLLPLPPRARARQRPGRRGRRGSCRRAVPRIDAGALNEAIRRRARRPSSA